MWFEGAQFIYLLNYDFYVGLQFPELIKKVLKKICFCRDLEDCGGVEVVCGFLTSIPCTQTKVKKKKFLLKKVEIKRERTQKKVVKEKKK